MTKSVFVLFSKDNKQVSFTLANDFESAIKEFSQSHTGEFKVVGHGESLTVIL